MAYRETEFAQSEFYHIYNRGNSKQKIFLDTADYIRFQDLLYLANNTESVSVRDARRVGVYNTERTNPLVAIGAYCIMPNHFHLLMSPITDGGVSEFMQKLSTGYVMYFNRKHGHTGSLFEGKFKSKHAGDDRYLKYLFAYIHLNPVRTKSTDLANRTKEWNSHYEQAVQYPFSSCQDYVQDYRDESMILSKNPFPNYFSNPSVWKVEMLDWFNYED